MNSDDLINKIYLVYFEAENCHNFCKYGATYPRFFISVINNNFISHLLPHLQFS